MKYFNDKAFILQQQKKKERLCFCGALWLTSEVSPGYDHLAMCLPEIPNHIPGVLSLKGY